MLPVYFKHKEQLKNNGRDINIDINFMPVSILIMGAKCKIPWKDVQLYYNAEHGAMECCRHFGFTKSAWGRAIRVGYIIRKPCRETSTSCDTVLTGKTLAAYNIDLTGKTFGYLTAVRKEEKVVSRDCRRWICACVCGKETPCLTNELLHNVKTSCGCKRTPRGNLNKKWTGYGEISGSHWCVIKSCSGQRYKNTYIPFDLTIEQIWDLFLAQNRKCALSGVDLVLDGTVGGRANRTASLDRINSDKGYTIDNVQWVHKVVNIMKMELSMSEFKEWVLKINNTLNK